MELLHVVIYITCDALLNLFDSKYLFSTKKKNNLSFVQKISVENFQKTSSRRRCPQCNFETTRASRAFTGVIEGRPENNQQLNENNQRNGALANREAGGGQENRNGNIQRNHPEIRNVAVVLERIDDVGNRNLQRGNRQVQRRSNPVRGNDIRQNDRANAHFPLRNRSLIPREFEMVHCASCDKIFVSSDRSRAFCSARCDRSFY